MASVDRVAEIISEAFAAEVELTCFNEIVGGPPDEDGDYAVDVTKVAEKVAVQLQDEGLIV